jgi:hypothetical protein
LKEEDFLYIIVISTIKEKKMIKSIQYFILTMILTTASIYAGSVYVQYYNKDSKAYTFDAKCSGMTYKVTFDASKTSSSTIQGSGPCIIETASGKVELKDGNKIEIKDGKIEIK